MSLILHCGGKHSSFAEVAAVEVPQETESYRPVPHGDMIRLLGVELASRFGLKDPVAKYGLNKGGAQLFGTFTYDLSKQQSDMEVFTQDNGNSIDGDYFKQYGLSIGFRNSYDKTLSAAFAGGSSVFVCDNLSFSGSSFTIMRKHTPNIWDDLVDMVIRKVRDLNKEFVRNVWGMESMKQFGLTLDRGYEILGRARGNGVLTQTQTNVAMCEWTDLQTKDDHKFLSDRNTAYGLYQGFTEALKLGKSHRKIDEYTGVWQLFEELDIVQQIGGHRVEDAVITEYAGNDDVFA